MSTLMCIYVCTCVCIHWMRNSRWRTRHAGSLSLREREAGFIIHSSTSKCKGSPDQIKREAISDPNQLSDTNMRGGFHYYFLFDN